VVPMASKSGSRRRKSASWSAPAIMASVPSIAPFVPPLTGASTTTAWPELASWTRCPKSLTAVGETLLMTTTAVPAAGGDDCQLASSPEAASSM
jgi:hypothetical protein